MVVLNRISLNGVVNNGCIPKIYYEAREKLGNNIAVDPLF